MRGFDIRGVGPHVTRTTYDTSTIPATLYTGSDYRTREALSDTAYYMTRAELALPLGVGARGLGLKPSIHMDVGAVFGGKTPTLLDSCAAANAAGTACATATRQYTDSSRQLLYLDSSGASTTTNTGTPYTYSISAYQQRYAGNSASPRLSIGFGIDWASPLAPLRIDIAKALLKQPGDDTKLVTFNIGTTF